MGYLYLCGVPLIVRGTFIYAGYLQSCQAPRIVRGTSDCAGIVPLVDTWRSIVFSIFPSNIQNLYSFIKFGFNRVLRLETIK